MVVIAIRREPRREIVTCGDATAPTLHAAKARRATIAHCCQSSQSRRTTGAWSSEGLGGEEIYRATQRVRSMQLVETCTVQDLNRVHGFERNRQVKVMMCGLAVVDAKAVEQDERLREAATTGG